MYVNDMYVIQPLYSAYRCMCVCGVSIFSPKIREIYGGMRGEGKGLCVGGGGRLEGKAVGETCNKGGLYCTDSAP